MCVCVMRDGDKEASQKKNSKTEKKKNLKNAKKRQKCCEIFQNQQ